MAGSNTPYIPNTDSGLLSWSTNFDDIVSVDYASLGVTAPEASAITAAVSAYDAALTAATNPSTRTPVTVATKNSAKTALLSIVRPIAQRIAINPTIDPETKVDLGLNTHESLPTPISPPTSFPLVALDSITPGAFRMKYNDSDTPTTKAKPYGVIAGEVWLHIGTTAQPTPTDLVYWGPATKSPFTIDFDPADAGKVCTVYMRWVNRNRGVGPWSSGVSATIAF